MTRYTSHEVTARIGVPANRSSFVGWPSVVGPSGRTYLLDSFTLKRSLLRTGKRILRLERLHGRPRGGLCATLDVGGLFAQRLKLLRLPAQSADLDRACFRNEVFTHTKKFLSRSVEPCLTDYSRQANH